MVGYGLDVFIWQYQLVFLRRWHHLISQLALQRDSRLHGLVRPGYGIDDDVLGHLLSASFYHGNAALDPCHYKVKVGLLALLWRQEGFKLTIHPAHAQARHRPIKRRARQHQGAAGGNHRHHIGAEARVHTQHGSYHLHFLAVAFREEGADRPVDQAANQHCFVARPALTLNKAAAANLARGIEFLFVVDA